MPTGNIRPESFRPEKSIHTACHSGRTEQSAFFLPPIARAQDAGPRSLAKKTSSSNRRRLLRVRTCTARRPFRNQPSNHMAFPHPQSRKDHDRNEDKSSPEGIVRKSLKRTIDIAEYRNSRDNVNPAKNRTCGSLTHNSSSIRSLGHVVTPKVLVQSSAA